MKITRILHASVNHADAVGPTTAFYADILGLQSAPRPDIGIPGAWLNVGDAQGNRKIGVVGNFAFHPIHRFLFEKDDRIIVADRRF